jgi:AraC-like DNA-binding protein
MTEHIPDLPGISLPFGTVREEAASARYSFDNRNRGPVPFVIIQRTLSGSGQFRWQGRMYPVPAGHAFLAVVPEPSAYAYPADATEPWVFSWLNFYGSVALALARSLRGLFGPVLALPDRTAAAAAFTSLCGLAERRTPGNAYSTAEACYGFLMEWARQLEDPRRAAQDPVETTLRLCRTRYREPLGIKELAAACGVTREHLTREFAARMGTGPATYLRSIRTEAARAMLKDPTNTPREVAMRCGFASPRALHRALDGPPSG